MTKAYGGPDHMTKVPHDENIIKTRQIVIHHPFVSIPIAENFCAVALAEYLNWGWKQAQSAAGDIHLVHANAPYRMVS